MNQELKKKMDDEGAGDAGIKYCRELVLFEMLCFDIV